MQISACFLIVGLMIAVAMTFIRPGSSQVTTCKNLEEKPIPYSYKLVKDADDSILIDGIKVPKDPDTTAFSKEVLDMHNAYRKLHEETKPLTPDNALNKIAEDWSNWICDTNLEAGMAGIPKLPVTPIEDFDTSTFITQKDCEKYGVSVFREPESPYVPGCSVVSYLYSTGSTDYKYDEETQITEPTFTNDVSRFIQIIWKKTGKIGIGSCTDEKFGFTAVMVYDKPGNTHGEFKNNVGKLAAPVR